MQQLPLSPRVVLLGAAQLVRERGWCQFRLVGSCGEVCMMGAVDRYIHERISDPNIADEINGAATMHLCMIVHDRTKLDPVAWNDTRGRTADEVIAMLEFAAAA